MSRLTPEQINAMLGKTPGATVYLVGAGGCGMSGLGHLLLDLGHSVAGSDLALNQEIQQLRRRGARIEIGHDVAHLAAANPVLVVYSSAIRMQNPELHAARARQIPVVRRAALLAALMERQRGICVAGMHGKTTTAAWLAFALRQLSANPSYAVGALVPQLQPHARFENSESWFVAEADESDGSLCEFRPEAAIVLNLDEEHLDFYANFEAIARAFEQFASRTRGTVIYCADDARLAELFSRRPNSFSYGFHSLSAYRIERTPGDGSDAPACFDLWHQGGLLGSFTIGLAGEKNISNAAAVIAMLHQLGFPPRDISSAVAPFRGASRRQEELFRDARFQVFDDYGHHPSEITATLEMLRSKKPRRLLVAFQPHRFTRTQQLLSQFAVSFGGADRLWLAEVYAASEEAIPGVNSAALAEAIRTQGEREVTLIPDVADLPEAIRQEMQPGDLVLFLGAGDITHAAHAMAEILRSEAATPKETLFAELAARVSPETLLRPDEPLSKKTTLRVGGTADFYVEPASENELAAVLRFCGERHLPFLILGRGSNLLIKDKGVRGVVICLAHPAFSRIEMCGDRLHCGAGAKLKLVAAEARRHCVSGLEFLEGIPGSIGGALRMNAGAMGSWMFDVVETIRFMDYSGNIHERKSSEVAVEYRGCPLFKNHVALGAVLKGDPAPGDAIRLRIEQFNRKRWESQPAAPSAGCIFKNPETIPAGKLIDELGLKGTRVGGASVSTVHGNFIINEGGATAQDVLRLIDLIKDRAKSARGIELKTEVEIIGE
jgi:UDP-N-acetylmuramate--alanine ligase